MSRAQVRAGSVVSAAAGPSRLASDGARAQAVLPLARNSVARRATKTLAGNLGMDGLARSALVVVVLPGSWRS